MFPANVNESFPGTVDVALNCQLPATFGATGTGVVVGAGAGVVAAAEGLSIRADGPPQPENEMHVRSARSVADCLMEHLHPPKFRHSLSRHGPRRPLRC